MHMPKTAINKNYRLIFWEHDIRLPGITLIIFAVTKPVPE